MRERRHVLGISQADLAETLGVSFQQIQKYEKGGAAVRHLQGPERIAVVDV